GAAAHAARRRGGGPRGPAGLPRRGVPGEPARGRAGAPRAARGGGVGARGPRAARARRLGRAGGGRGRPGAAAPAPPAPLRRDVGQPHVDLREADRAHRGLRPGRAAPGLRRRLGPLRPRQRPRGRLGLRDAPERHPQGRGDPRRAARAGRGDGAGPRPRPRARPGDLGGGAHVPRRPRIGRRGGGAGRAAL
ncbi:MAG: hypothetical protein AVDCRST_MAG13-672, partial [uncultured Solirubrobacteraceae bacterium]